MDAVPQLIPPAVRRKEKLSPLDIPTTWPASLALEATMMATRLYHTERWSEEDDRMLRTMSKSGKSLTLMTARLKLPMSAIRARAEDLGLGIVGTEIGKRKRR